MTRHLGQPCWRIDRLASVVTTIAKMDSERSHVFLASHSPIRDIRDERNKASLNEQELFDAIVDPSRAEALAILCGEPGSGKSHLVHWLKLRCDYAVRVGDLKKVTTVLIQRRKGNLKDALDQMVQQLPPHLQHHLEPIRQAISNISQTQAREMLATQLFHELGPERWAERGRSPLPRGSQNVRELCTSTGFREWLCRSGGVIDRNIKRLTDTSAVEERDTLPEFVRKEFVSPARYRANNTDDVLAMMDEFDEPDENLADIVAALFNLALRDALKELSGLGDNKLRDIFDRIRVELHKEGRTLALFIEDVSVLSELDTEVFKAVEPQSRPDLGRLIAVLGMTQAGLAKLRDNELERVTHLLSVGGSVDAWREAPEEVARFAARYLNTLRLDDSHLRVIAERRREGGDLGVSACTDCSIVESCHATFGSIEFEGTTVGLFPFTPAAPHRLLRSLDVSAPGVRQNPRGLLDQVLRPLLMATDAFEALQFPPVGRLAVNMHESANWEPFLDLYCGTWRREQRDRLRFFAQGWLDDSSDDVDDYARRLSPFLKAFGFPDFTKTISTRPTASKRSHRVPTPEPYKPPASSSPTALPNELQDLLDTTQKWLDEPTSELTKDRLPRELLHGFLKAALPIEEVPGLPQSVFEGLFKDIASIHIEGQRSAPIRDKFAVRFERSEATRSLIVALGYFRFVGRSSWTFPHSATYKRTCARWLRRHQMDVLRSCQPEKLEPSLAVAGAVEFLALVAILRKRAKLPDDRVELVAEVLSPLDTAPESVTSKGAYCDALKRIVDDQARVREFLLDELSVPQGAGKVIFINPLPILEAGRAFHDRATIARLDERFSTSFWKTRYSAVVNAISLYGDLPALLESERAAVAAAAREIRSILVNAGYADGEEAALVRYFADMLELRKALVKAKTPVPDPEFDSQRASFSEVKPWANALASAERVIASEGVSEFVRFSPATFLRTHSSIGVASRYFARVQAEISAVEAPLIAEGDPDDLARLLLEELATISALADPEEVIE